jgi:uncharacterized repeat protein (TIGR01451 family)
MAKLWKVLALLALLCFAQVVRADDDGDDGADEDDEDFDVDRAHLIVSKVFKERFGVQGRNLTVEIQVYNAGNSSALGVSITDAKLPEGLQLVEGELSATFNKIDDKSMVTHSYVVVPTSAVGEVYLNPATVEYKAESDAEDKQVGYSTQAGVYVMTPVEQIQQHALTVGSYISLGAMQSGKDWRNFAIFVGVIGGLLGANQLVKTFKSATTTRKRQKALADLEKEQ